MSSVAFFGHNANMGQTHDRITGRLRTFIESQRIFFTATAPLSGTGTVNLSPKGLTGSFAVIDDITVAYLDFAGSNAETIAHLRENGRITLMWCAFQGPPTIVRIHGRGEPVFRDDPRWRELRRHFVGIDPSPHGLRAIILVHAEMIRDTCGYAVPFMAFDGERDLHARRFVREDDASLGAYFAAKEHVATSIDGLPGLPLPLPPTPEADLWRDQVIGAFASESERLVEVLRGLGPADWARPTACQPWTVVQLMGHVLVATGRILGVLDEDSPVEAMVTAAGYYRPDVRFSTEANAARVALGQERAAAVGDPAALVAEFDTAWRDVDRLCRRESPDRVIVTRHGDAMLLTDFLITRIVELGLHGLDLAAALERRPWITRPAIRVLTPLLLSSAGSGAGVEAVAVFGWDDVTLLRKVTGRDPLTADEARHVAERGIVWLTLG